MTRVLLTAYGPYDEWQENTSWLVLQEVLREATAQPELTTRLYPVELEEVRHRLAEDLGGDYDYVVHLGQAPGAAKVAFEGFGINVAQLRGQPPDAAVPLALDGPPAYRTTLPIEHWVRELTTRGYPSRVSFHAGTYLCNAALYLSHYFAERMSLKTQVVFLHLPLSTDQALSSPQDLPGLPVTMSAEVVRWVLSQLALG